MPFSSDLSIDGVLVPLSQSFLLLLILFTPFLPFHGHDWYILQESRPRERGGRWPALTSTSSVPFPSFVLNYFLSWQSLLNLLCYRHFVHLEMTSKLFDLCPFTELPFPERSARKIKDQTKMLTWRLDLYVDTCLNNGIKLYYVVGGLRCERERLD